MAVAAISTFERFFREVASLDVDKTDLKRYQDFVRRKVADLLIVGEARAKEDGRDVIELRDVPITKGLQESIHQFRRADASPEARALISELVAVPQLDLAVADETTEALPDISGGLSLALARSFDIVDPGVRNPATPAWERAFRLFDLLL
jgi:hypothetical protein